MAADGVFVDYIAILFESFDLSDILASLPPLCTSHRQTQSAAPLAVMKTMKAMKSEDLLQ